MTRVILVKAVFGVGSRMVDSHGQEPLAGYYQRFGVRAQSIEAVEGLVREYVLADLGAVIVEVDDEGEFDARGVHSDIPVGPKAELSLGIWYVGGRAFYRRKQS
ncbi:MAG TPA: hypothetical protein VFQ91_27150 [Bryobacteraceae bacterium]|nr:hypothetical protein [Bryobacteraceae bacterium]